jgi:hypothetical protein
VSDSLIRIVDMYIVNLGNFTPIVLMVVVVAVLVTVLRTVERTDTVFFGRWRHLQASGSSSQSKLFNPDGAVRQVGLWVDVGFLVVAGFLVVDG